MKQMLNENQVNHLIELGLDTKYLRSVPCLDSEITALSGKVIQTLLINDLLDIINLISKQHSIEISHVKDYNWRIVFHLHNVDDYIYIYDFELINVLYNLVCKLLSKHYV